jgi:hypothetical protein
MRVIVGLMSLWLVGCTNGKPTGSGVVSGNLLLPRDAAGRAWAVALSSDGKDSGIVASASGTAAEGLTIPYQLDKVPDGKYFLVAWVDQSNGGDIDTHNMGDLLGVWSDGAEAGSTPNLTVAGGRKQRADIYLQTEAPAEYPDVSGTVTLPSATPGKPWYVFVDTSTDDSDGYLDIDSGTVGDGASFDYRITNVAPGSGYFLYAWVDENENGLVDDGDLVGYYGGTAGQPPASGGLDLPMPAPRGEAGDVDADVEVQPVARTVSGTVSLPADNAHNGAKFKIYFDDDGNPTNGAKAIRTGSVPRSGNSLSFKMTGLSGPYYVAALVDVDGDGQPSKGDLWGYYIADPALSTPDARDKFQVPDQDTTLQIGTLSVITSITKGNIDAGADASGLGLLVYVQPNSFARRLSDVSAIDATLDAEGKGSYFHVNGTTGDVFVEAMAYPKPTSIDTHPLLGDFFGFAGSDDVNPPATSTNLPADGGEISFKLVKVHNLIRGKIDSNQSMGACTFVISTEAGSLSNGVVRKYYSPSCSESDYAAFNLPSSPLFLTMWTDINKNDMQDTGDLLGYYGDNMMMPPASGLDVTDNQSVAALDFSMFEVK